MTRRITLYSASELKKTNPTGFRCALEGWRKEVITYEILWADETIESLKALIEASGLTIKKWNLRTYNSWIHIMWDKDIKDFVGNRALAWLESNLLCHIREKRPFSARLKRYDDKWFSFHRFGKIPPCPFTGYFADDVYLEALIKAIKNGNTLEVAYNGLAQECQKLLEEELENQNSEEYFVDFADANDYLFTKGGLRIG